MIDYCDECGEVISLDCCAVCGRGGLCPDCAEECELSHEIMELEGANATTFRKEERRDER